MKKPVIGLALGGGAAKGFAHIGVLRVLEEHGIEVDIVAGSSAGALIGGLYCAGLSPIEIQSIAEKVGVKDWIDLTLPTLGVIKGKKIQNMIINFVGHKNIEDLSKRFISIATDLNSSNKYVFDRGPLHKAIRASISFPGLFEPLIMNDMTLVDGALIEVVPTSELRALKVDILIAVDLGTTSLDQGNVNIIDVLIQTVELLTEKSPNNVELDADIVISPDLSSIGPSRFDLVEQSIKIGYDAALSKINEIKAFISKIND